MAFNFCVCCRSPRDFPLRSNLQCKFDVKLSDDITFQGGGITKWLNNLKGLVKFVLESAPAPRNPLSVDIFEGRSRYVSSVIGGTAIAWCQKSAAYTYKSKASKCG